jgi:hypothetical protein
VTKRITGWLAAGGLAVFVSIVLSLAAIPSANACSCRTLPSIRAEVSRATAVYIARPEPGDLLPGVRFQVLRVLKGPIRHNVRVGVSGAGSDCGKILPGTYVLTANDAGLRPVGLCTSLFGGAAIREAEIALGAGRSISTQPDRARLAEMILAVLLVLSIGAVVSWQIRRTVRSRSTQ